VLVDEFLGGTPIAGRSALDAGCGLGFFSDRLVQHGAVVTACDLGPSLVEATRDRTGCEARVADVLELSDVWRNRFDIVVSSECIEHTPDRAARSSSSSPSRSRAASSRSARRTSSGNPVALATAVKMRPFDGYENFSTWRSLRRALHAAGATVVREHGLHLFPFQFGLHGLSRWCDGHLQALKPLMINLCVLAMKDQSVRRWMLALFASRPGGRSLDMRSRRSSSSWACRWSSIGLLVRESAAPQPPGHAGIALDEALNDAVREAGRAVRPLRRRSRPSLRPGGGTQAIRPAAAGYPRIATARLSCVRFKQENSLTWTMRWLLALDAGASSTRLGHELTWLRLSMLGAFMFALLVAGAGLTWSLLLALFATAILNHLAAFDLSAYPFLLVLPLLSVALYVVADRYSG
jgi:2-polyprenyl-6-hydroxyphenyl methylase/3-demethylubiquinone-9 3-methyltransferase